MPAGQEVYLLQEALAEPRIEVEGLKEPVHILRALLPLLPPPGKQPPPGLLPPTSLLPPPGLTTPITLLPQSVQPSPTNQPSSSIPPLNKPLQKPSGMGKCCALLRNCLYFS